MADEYALLVRVRALEGCAARLRTALLDLAERSRATTFCHEFAVADVIERDGEFWLLERFPSRAAYDRHVATPHAQRFLHEHLPALIGEREVLTVVAPAPAPPSPTPHD